MEYYSNNYSIKIININIDTYFLGKYITGDTKYFIAVDNLKDIRYESFDDNLTTELENNILRISKNCKIELIQGEDEKYLTNIFEYPSSSGDFYPINRSSFPYYNSMELFKNEFTYPFQYLGNNGSIVTFNNSTDLTNFITSGMTKHQQIYTTKYLPSINSINSVSITTTLENAINNIFIINY
jgi:hypothetical protein